MMNNINNRINQAIIVPKNGNIYSYVQKECEIFMDQSDTFTCHKNN